jgi:predicted DNA-binding transcriptional regulator AlpA
VPHYSDFNRRPEAPINPHVLYTLSEVATYLGVHRRTVLRWIEEERGPKVTRLTSKQPRVLGSDLLSYIGVEDAARRLLSDRRLTKGGRT